MSRLDVNESFIAAGRILGCVATHDDPDTLAMGSFRNAIRNEPTVFRAPTTATAYLQAPTGWRQRVRLTVLLRVDHPLSGLVPLTEVEVEQEMQLPTAFRPARLSVGEEFEDLRGHLGVLARSGMPLVLEKCIADRLNLDELSPRVVGPNGVQVVQRQTLRVWNTLAVWMREYTRSPRGAPSLLRSDASGHGEDGFAEAAPILY
ncbi:MAG: hypothetical protein R3A48_21295 [Polyangiales bacterium]